MLQTSELIQIYQCFCDETRLRILNALSRGPLCVCHLQELLDETQVKVSKHLSYLREKGLVEAKRHQNWMIYALPAVRPAELDTNLRCLQDCVQSNPVFKSDPAHATGTEDEQLVVFRRVRDEIRRVFEAYAAGRSNEAATLTPRLPKST